MLQELKIRSFKAFSSEGTEEQPGIKLEPFTMLVGPNGSGKTTLLQAMEVLGQLVGGTISEMLDEHQWEYSDLPHLRSDRPQIELCATVQLGQERVRWTLVLGTRRFPGIARERIEKWEGEGWRAVVEREGRSVRRLSERTGEQEVTRLTLPASWLYTIDPKEDRHDFPTLVALADWARRIRAHYFLDPVALRAPSQTDTDEVGPHGEDLAAFLARLKDRPQQFERLIERVRDHYPRLVSIHPRRTRYGWTHLEVTEKWNGEEATFNARQVSDGLLRLIAVAAMYELREPPSVLLLDEVENGLHPRLLGGMVSLLQGLAHEGRTQVIVTTHSPITLNYMPVPEAALLVTRRRGGGVTVTPMPETHNFHQLREHFDLGELWYNVGEERLMPETGKGSRKRGKR
jgi:predicted ATPase